MENKKRFWVIIALFVFIGILIFVYKVYKGFSEVNEAMQPIETLTPLNFEDVHQTIYIKTKIWGLLGGHSRISISDTKDDLVNENDITFDNSLIYYTIQYPDSLLIFLNSKSYSEERSSNKRLGDIKIKITEFKASKNKEYSENYKEMGLKKIEAGY